MIKIDADKAKCCGCTACVQKCPRQCISLKEDKEGFLYPQVKEELCVNCGLCEKVCPIISPYDKRLPIVVYAAKNFNESIRMESSSGGIFSSVAEEVIQQGGAVFGAKFDANWEVVHCAADDIKSLAAFRGSKYVQSKILNTYSEAEHLLKTGRRVLFSGTPCQISGLLHYLGRDYPNLLTVDFICHGVPSPGVFRTFLRDEINNAARKSGKKNTVSLPCIPLVTEEDGLDRSKIKSIFFRDKRNGWKKYGFALELSEASADGEKNSVLLSYKQVDKHPFMDGFLKNLYLRPSCYSCPAKGLSSGSDITLGDFWGIETLMPEIDDDKGISVITVNTAKGKDALESIKATTALYETQWAGLVSRNPSVASSANLPEARSRFYEADGKTFEQKIKVLCKKKFSLRGMAFSCIQKVPRPIRRAVKALIFGKKK